MTPSLFANKAGYRRQTGVVPECFVVASIAISQHDMVFRTSGARVPDTDRMCQTFGQHVNAKAGCGHRSYRAAGGPLSCNINTITTSLSADALISGARGDRHGGGCPGRIGCCWRWHVQWRPAASLGNGSRWIVRQARWTMYWRSVCRALVRVLAALWQEAASWTTRRDALGEHCRMRNASKANADAGASLRSYGYANSSRVALGQGAPRGSSRGCATVVSVGVNGWRGIPARAACQVVRPGDIPATIRSA
ncbi:hypothetical protein B0O95_11431 [Mycetohabitans endofungorum]|uniref:Uncharacterized protein n=1 Tax=Mycetohabitans endofungorum TaxID=417203 RepID=A0A2P5K7L6_9BURK|nr:hypothetical protein B0O95_11431 [Mycetohabitans endofungorum]